MVCVVEQSYATVCGPHIPPPYHSATRPYLGTHPTMLWELVVCGIQIVCVQVPSLIGPHTISFAAWGDWCGPSNVS